MPFSFGQFERIFDLRDAAGKPYILIGGQAVNYRAENFLSIEPELAEWLPFTSVDIDYYGNRDDVIRVAADLGLPAYFPLGRGATALAGTIPFTVNDVPAYIELVRLVPGLDKNKIQSWAITARRGKNEIRVLDPISLLACKASLALTIDQKQRRDAEHMQMLITCERAFLREALHGVMDGVLPARGWLGAVERVLKLAESATGKKAARQLNVNWSEALPGKEIAASKLPLVVQLRQKRLPQWRAKLNPCVR